MTEKIPLMSPKKKPQVETCVAQFAYVRVNLDAGRDQYEVCDHEGAYVHDCGNVHDLDKTTI